MVGLVEDSVLGKSVASSQNRDHCTAPYLSNLSGLHVVRRGSVSEPQNHSRVCDPDGHTSHSFL
jgi:hypothetical protein